MSVRVLGLLPYPLDRVPGQRFRIEQWVPILAAEGVEMCLSPFLSPTAMDVLHHPGHSLLKARETLRAFVGRMRELRRLDGYQLSFVYREAALLLPPVLEGRVARRLPLVFDFDDAIYLPSSSEANKWTLYLKGQGKTADLCRLAAHVTVGNDHLALFAREHASQVTVLPTSIDTETYVPAPRAPNPRPVVGWSGSVTTLPYLMALQETLGELRRRVAFDLLVIGGEVAMPGLEVRSQPWRAAKEVDDLRQMDVGLMPLPDDPWTKGKCGLKALQYMALGIPPVVSPVGVNRDIVRDGENGFHASTSAEWVDRIVRLLLDPTLRERLGREARLTVETRYSARVQAPRLAALLRTIACGQGRERGRHRYRPGSA